MKLLLLINTLLFVLISCSLKNQNRNLLKEDTVKKIVKPPSVQMTKELIDIDTSISIKLFNLKPFEKTLNKIQKKKIIISAINSAMPNASYRYLELNCWKLDSKTNQPYEDTTNKAPDCRLNEFYLIDLDKDGDLDIIYSSSIDQYIQGDTNYLLLLQNNNGNYKKLSINGYLYAADFSELSKGTINFKTVSRPCCDYFNYNFFETTFNTKTWSMTTNHVLEIHKSKVHEL